MAKRSAFYADRIWEMKGDRLGLTRHSLNMTFAGIAVGALIGAPTILRDRWLKRKGSRRLQHIALEQLYFTDQTGRLHTAKRFMVHDVKSGHVEDIGRFYDVQMV